LYAAALPHVLCALDLSDNVVLHLQDWETVGAALTIKTAILSRQIGRAVSILAIHNPYDEHLDQAGWVKLTDRPIPAHNPPTFLGQMLPLIDAPPATVSREFAKDLTSDPLQTTHFAPHLQAAFKRFPVQGVDNGPFGQLGAPFTATEIGEARAGRPGLLLAAKQKLRDVMKGKMAAYRPDERWGDVDFAKLANDVPVFLMNGRLDPGQKGFDVATRAIERVLDKGLDARFVLTPIVGNAPQPFVDDLEHLGKAKAGQVVVYPFRMETGYRELLAGCTFSLWPSMYEPFGGVSEFLLRGTPVIARATGGLRQQVVDFGSSPGKGNGILYSTILPAAGSNEWRDIQEEARPRSRMGYSVYQDQVKKLADAIERAVAIFGNTKSYGRLLSNVYGSVSGYAWSRAASEYAQLYHIACS
jgi:glycosyltransferase involved in cell wall biosynthesis